MRATEFTNFNYKTEPYEGWNGDGMIVRAYDGKDEVGHVIFEPTEDDVSQWYAVDVEVEEPYQRKGIATKMYDIAKKAAKQQNAIIVKSHAQTNDGRGLWQDKNIWEQQTISEDKSKDPIVNTVIDFYKHVGKIHTDPIDDYVSTTKEMLGHVSDPTLKSKLLDIFRQAKQNPYVQGGVVTTIGALLAGGVLSSAQKMGLSPSQTNLALQAILNTVIPTVVSRINGKSWSDTVKYTLASAGIGTGIAGIMEEKEPDINYYMNEGCGIFAVAKAMSEPNSSIYILSKKDGDSWSKSFPYEVTHVFVNTPSVGQSDVKGVRGVEEMSRDFNLSKDDYSIKGPFNPKEFFSKFMGNSDTKPLYGTVKDIKNLQYHLQKQKMNADELDEDWKSALATGAMAGAMAMGANAKAPNMVQQIVEPGDTVYSIARQNNVKPLEIYKLNKMDRTTKLEVGQKVLVPDYSKPISKMPATVKPTIAQSTTSFKDKLTSMIPQFSRDKEEGVTLLSDNGDAEAALQTAAKNAGLKGAELAQFMAQTRHESWDFGKMKEVGNKKRFAKYETPRKAKQLGNKVKGDGERFKGRGFIQLTGRDNYTRASQQIFGDDRLVKNPDLASRLDIGAQIALWFWKNQVRPNVNNFNNTKEVTNAINPGLSGLQDRHNKFKEYMAVL